MRGFTRMHFFWVEDNDLVCDGIVPAPHTGKALHTMPDDADGQSFMGMAAKGVLTIAGMQELDIPQIVGTPEPGPFAFEQLLFAAVQVWSQPTG
jgi:hypothetical protein